MTHKILPVIILAALAFSGVAVAQEEPTPNAGLLPDSPFAFIDSVFERVELFFAFGAKAKAGKNMDFAEERLAEAAALAAKGVENRPQEALERYQEHLDEALAKAAEARANGDNVEDVFARIFGATVRHQETLAEVYERVPEQARDAIERAMEMSAKSHDTALEAISAGGQNGIKEAVNGATQDMQERLDALRSRGVPIPDIPR